MGFKIVEKVNILSYDEFDELVKLHLNNNSDYEVVAAMEWGNDQDHLFKIEPIKEYCKDYYNKYTKTAVEKFMLDGKWKSYSLSPYDILEYLANETCAIDFGYYLIRVSW